MIRRDLSTAGLGIPATNTLISPDQSAENSFDNVIDEADYQADKATKNLINSTAAVDQLTIDFHAQQTLLPATQTDPHSTDDASSNPIAEEEFISVDAKQLAEDEIEQFNQRKMLNEQQEMIIKQLYDKVMHQSELLDAQSANILSLNQQIENNKTAKANVTANSGQEPINLTVKKQITQLKSTISKLKQQNTEQSTEIATLQQRLRMKNHRESNQTSLKQQVTIYRAEISFLKKKLSEASLSKILDYQNTIREQLNLIRKYKDEVKILEQAERKRAREQDRLFEKTNSGLNSNVTSTIGLSPAMTSIIGKLKAELQDSKGVVERFDNLLQAQQAELAQLKQNYEERGEIMYKLTKKLKETQADFNEEDYMPKSTNDFIHSASGNHQTNGLSNSKDVPLDFALNLAQSINSQFSGAASAARPQSSGLSSSQYSSRLAHYLNKSNEPAGPRPIAASSHRNLELEINNFFKTPKFQEKIRAEPGTNRANNSANTRSPAAVSRTAIMNRKQSLGSHLNSTNGSNTNSNQQSNASTVFSSPTNQSKSFGSFNSLQAPPANVSNNHWFSKSSAPSNINPRYNTYSSFTNPEQSTDKIHNVSDEKSFPSSSSCSAPPAINSLVAALARLTGH
jgi:hypothetical protein